ncbi:hypothetical protein SP695_004639 [Salmonella enterica]|nr:hypothetical protein [Salmonella enterica]
MNDFFWNATALEIAKDPAALTKATEALIEYALSGAFADMRKRVDTAFESLLEDIGKDKAVTHVFTDGNGNPHPARPAFFSEQWQGKKRLLDERWLQELEQRASTFQGYFAELESSIFDALERYEADPTPENIDALRLTMRVFQDANQLAVDATEHFHRAERWLVLLWAEATYYKKPFRRCGGVIPTLKTTTPPMELTA